MSKGEDTPKSPFAPLADRIIVTFDEIQAGKENHPDLGEIPSSEVPAKTSGEEEEAL